MLDVVLQKSGTNSYFEQVMRFGKRTEEMINLFNQYNSESQSEHSVDSILDKVEEKIRS